MTVTTLTPEETPSTQPLPEETPLVPESSSTPVPSATSTSGPFSTPSVTPSASSSPVSSPSASPSPYVFSGGSGTIGDPYQLETAQDVQSIDQASSKYFTLTQDINMALLGNFRPLNAFSGVIYGNNHHLYNLTVNTAGSNTAALFTSVSGTLVSLVLQSYHASSQTGYATGFAGHLTGMLSNCSISGTITSPLGGNGYNGGIGNPIYVTKSGSAIINLPAFSPISVQFNGNHVSALSP